MQEVLEVKGYHKKFRVVKNHFSAPERPLPWLKLVYDMAKMLVCSQKKQ